MVFWTGKRSFLKASCWSLLVMKGGTGLRRRSRALHLRDPEAARPRGRARTVGGLPRRCRSRCSLPSFLARWAGKTGGSPAVELGRDRPVLLGHERADLALAVADEPQRHGLHAPGREPAAHLVPQERADLVAHEPVEDAARLLGVDLLRVDLARVLEGLLDGAFGDLVEDHAAHLLLGLGRLAGELLGEVPADGLALAVRVGGQEDRRRRPWRPP